ncbi:MAG: VTT domain-containing protein [Chloroflexi bacterium]|nr:VTT domain-containing protein [Chloroflexota bacterium]
MLSKRAVAVRAWDIWRNLEHLSARRILPRRGARARWVAILVVLAIIVTIVLMRGRIGEIESYGYLGVFLVDFMGAAAMILPVPGTVAVYAGGGLLNPVYIALLAGIAEPLGELTGYAIGYGGQPLLENRRIYKKLVVWMESHGTITLFLLSVIPNPIFDLGGVAAGALRFPVLRFFLIVWAGKTIKSFAIAFAGSWSLEALIHLLQRIF